MTTNEQQRDILVATPHYRAWKGIENKLNAVAPGWNDDPTKAPLSAALDAIDRIAKVMPQAGGL